jgi:hypothetical protein
MLCILATGKKQAESNMAPVFGGSGVDWDAPLAAFAPLQVTTSRRALSVMLGVMKSLWLHTLLCLHNLLQC